MFVLPIEGVVIASRKQQTRASTCNVALSIGPYVIHSLLNQADSAVSCIPKCECWITSHHSRHPSKTCEYYLLGSNWQPCLHCLWMFRLQCSVLGMRHRNA